MVGLSSVLGRFDPMQRLFGRSIEDAYNRLLQNGRTAHLVPLLRLLHWTTAGLHRPMRRIMSRYLRDVSPAAVVSVLPNFNRVLRDAVQDALPGVPFIVLLTDYADFPPHFWMEPGIDRVIVGSQRAAEQAAERGLPAEQISRSSGMVLHPRFYAAGGSAAGRRVRRELGLASGDFVIMLLFGGKGAAEMEPLGRALLAGDPGWHVVALCGSNPPLFERLSTVAAHSGGRLHPLRFTDRMADYLAAADVLVTKPGPGSLAEAFHQRVPVVVTCNRRTIPQERYNTAMVKELDLGLVVSHWKQMPAAVSRIAGDEAFRARLGERLAALPRNRAVYEALEIMGREVGRPFATGR